jgi:putative ABC transport system permease protein
MIKLLSYLRKLSFKQTWKLTLEQPLMTVLTVLGTALSVAMLMVLVLVYQVKTTAFAPVSARNRMLYITVIEGAEMGSTGRAHTAIGQRTVKECFYLMQTPEAVSAAASKAEDMRTSAPGVKTVRESQVRFVDAAFWKVFDFSFISGEPFTEGQFKAATPVAVISEKIARIFFGHTEVVGQTIRLDFADYTIRGVVADVSRAVEEAYGEIWIPYSLNSTIMTANSFEGISGSLKVCILARETKDFDAIRQEAQQRIIAFNAGQKEWTANIWKQPVTGVQRMFYYVQQDRMQGVFAGMISLAALFLLLPVFNLLGIVFSQMQKRRHEIGVRKAFGANSLQIVSQILWENLLITLVGGLLGLGLSFVFFYVARDGLLEQTDVSLQAGMFIQPLLFTAAIGSCLLINLLSTGIPAWRTARKTVTDSLNANLFC